MRPDAMGARKIWLGEATLDLPPPPSNSQTTGIFFTFLVGKSRTKPSVARMACWIVDPNPTVDSEIPSDFYTTNLELKTYFFHFCTDFGSISPSSVSRGNTRDVLAPGTLKDIGLLSSEWIWWILCQPKKPWRLLLLGSVRRAMVCLLFFFSPLERSPLPLQLPALWSQWFSELPKVGCIHPDIC